MGIHLGFSPVHFVDVALVSNPTTRFVSSQYHTVFDDDISTLEYICKQVQPLHWSVLVRNASHLTTDEHFPIDNETWEAGPVSPEHKPCVPLVSTAPLRLENHSRPSTTTPVLSPSAAANSASGDTTNPLVSAFVLSLSDHRLPSSDSSSVWPSDSNALSSDLRVQF